MSTTRSQNKRYKATIRELTEKAVDTTATLTEKQREANALLAGPSRHIMLFGGARSGKTFLLVRAVVIRALRAKDSRHLIARFRFNQVKTFIGLDTFPKVMKTCFPGIPYKIDKSDWFVRLPNESEIWLGGLDEKERTEKVLGAEYSTLLLEECSQIGWNARNTVVTRLAQNSGLALKAYYSCNPPPQSHWAYKYFIKKEDPLTGQPLTDPDQVAAMLLNPADNADHIHADYIHELESLPERQRRRFLLGEWLPATENALWDTDWFDEYRLGLMPNGQNSVPDLQRIVVAVDPSGADDNEEKHNDEIGIVVAGVDAAGRAYVLEDLTVKAGPATWGRAVVSAFDRHRADAVVGETNFGGAMVKHVVQTAATEKDRKSKVAVPYIAVSASRGKVARAEPIAALYEQGKVHHVRRFPELEDELAGFTTAGYTGAKSPNRADALIWALSELFPGMIRRRKQDLVIEGAGDYDVLGF